MLNYVRTSGNLLVVWDGQQVLGVDTLRPGNNQKRVVWTADLADQVPGLPMQGVSSTADQRTLGRSAAAVGRPGYLQPFDRQHGAGQFRRRLLPAIQAI